MTELGKAFHDFYKLGGSGRWCCVKLDFDYNYAAYIRLTPSGFNVKFREDGHKPAIQIQSCNIDTEKGMVEFLERAVKEAKEYEKSIQSL